MSGKSTAEAGSRFGAELRLRRVRHRISLRELASRVHVDHGHLGKVERGTRTASRRLAEACDVVLSADGALRAAWAADQSVVGHRPAQLPSLPRSVVGRRDERRRVRERLTTSWHSDGPRTVVVAGPPGVGKTTLVLRCANDVAEHFPDGVLFADLRGYADDEPADVPDVLEQFLLALGVPATAVPRSADARAALYRSVLYDRRVLVVLDNAGRSEQVLPLLPGGRGCGVLVTSRTRLSGLTVRVGAHAVDVPPLREEEAVDMLRGVVGAQRVDAEAEAAKTLAAQCSYLPLALRVAAERVATRPWVRLGDLVDDLSVEAERLDLLAVPDADSLDVRRVFSWSHRSLDPDAARLFRLLGLHWDNEISLPAAAALAGRSPARTSRVLDMLTAAHLVREVDRHRYRQFDLLRVHAGELSGSIDGEEVRGTAVDRLLRWCLATAHAAGGAIAPYRNRPEPTVPTDDLVVPRLADRADALAWCERELPALVGATGRALDSGVPHVAHELPNAMADHVRLRRPMAAWRTMNTNGLTAARATGDRAAEASMLCNLGVADLDLGQLDLADERLTRALELNRRLGDRAGQGWCLLWLGNLERARGSFETSAVLLEHALAAFLDIDDTWAVAICRGYLGATHLALKRFDDALPQLRECEHTLRAMGDRQGEGRALDLTAKLHIGQESWAEAFDHLHRAVELRASAGDRHGQASTMVTLAKVQQDRGRLTAAIGSFRAALALVTELDDPRAEMVRARLHAIE